ncbi:sensor histidine kinase [Curtobacterium sp. 20TX0008]|uniref:sensor histidine kinase n=1 Tax=Curtobacterium sp. 20TX0008 TaxID=3022018 RepID=UPI00232F8761|nr:sensor histidine kinase [Curtobacterium sp. 20TX0008]MDB6426345.1 sensor histidine kinase [Curtobacterium sp. 20TX0008]
MTDTDRLDQAETVPLDDHAADRAQTVPLDGAVPQGATKPMPEQPRTPDGGPSSAPSGWGATPTTGRASAPGEQPFAPAGAAAQPPFAAAGAPGNGGGAGSGMTAGRFYREAWRRLPRDFGYMALTAVLLCTLYAAFPAALFGRGLRDLFNPFVLLMFFIALFVARWLGQFEKTRIGWADPRPIRPVDWTPRWQQNWWTRTGSAVANPHYWLYLLHAAVVYPLAALVTVGAGVVLLAGFAWPFVIAVAWGFLGVGGMYLPSSDSGALLAIGLLSLLSMAASVALLPLWARGSVLAHYWIDLGLLGGFRAEQLEQRVAGLQASRAGAVTAEGQALRQIERDLHDGPQQRLVRLRMDLAAAERAFDRDPEKAKRLIGEATEHAQDALDELRALSRGFAPPILLDRGLVAALEALVARTPIPVGLDVRLPEGLELATEIQRNVYFTVSELLTNTTKHAGASTAGVYLGLIVDASGLWYLTVSVTDDGRGGARPQEGHGIEGLMGRMRALDGELVVNSPEGGPTEATARIPLGALNGVPVVRG